MSERPKREEGALLWQRSAHAHSALLAHWVWFFVSSRSSLAPRAKPALAVHAGTGLLPKLLGKALNMQAGWYTLQVK